jgi:hypothetical protein
VTEPQRRVATVAAYLALFLVAVVVPCVIASHYGALNIPRSDDWSYLLSLFRWLDEGHIGFNNWVSMTLVGQLVITAPVAWLSGNSIAAVHVFTAVLGFAGLVALVHTPERDFRLRAWVLAFTIAVCPLWPTLAPTFMSEVPSFAVQCIFLALALHALRDSRLSYARYGGTMVVGFLAIAIRQYEIVPVLAVTVVAFARVRHDREARRRVLVVTGLLVVATAGLLGWWLSLPDSLSLAPEAQASGLVANLAVRMGGFVRLTGLCLLPVTIAVGPVRLVKRAWVASRVLTGLVAGGTAVWLAVAYVRVTDDPFVGNYVHLKGTLADDVLLGLRVPVMPESLFRLVVLVGSLSAIVLLVGAVPTVVALWTRARERRLTTVDDPDAAVLGLSIVGFLAAYGLAIVTTLPVFDRYGLQVLPIVGLAVIRVRRRVDLEVRSAAPARVRAPVGVLAALAVLALVAVVFATDSASYDATRWQVAEAVVRAGYPPTRINGGFEWIAWHRRVGPPNVRGKSLAERQRLKRAYLRPFCVDVMINPRFAGQVRNAIATGTVHGLGHEPERIIAIRKRRGCPGTDVPG